MRKKKIQWNEWMSVPVPAQDFSEEQEAKRKITRLLTKKILENALSARQKEILVLYYKEGKTMPEIARMLGITVSSVSHTHRRAINRIRNRLQPLMGRE